MHAVNERKRKRRKRKRDMHASKKQRKTRKTIERHRFGYPNLKKKKKGKNRS